MHEFTWPNIRPVILLISTFIRLAPMCFQQHMPIPKEGYIDFELYKRVVDECAENKLYSIRLCHRGEPLLHSKIVDMVKYAKDKGIKEVFTLTNGLLLNEKLIL